MAIVPNETFYSKDPSRTLLLNLCSRAYWLQWQAEAYIPKPGNKSSTKWKTRNLKCYISNLYESMTFSKELIYNSSLSSRSVCLSISH